MAGKGRVRSLESGFDGVESGVEFGVWKVVDGLRGRRGNPRWRTAAGTNRWGRGGRKTGTGRGLWRREQGLAWVGRGETARAPALNIHYAFHCPPRPALTTGTSQCQLLLSLQTNLNLGFSSTTGHHSLGSRRLRPFVASRCLGPHPHPSLKLGWSLPAVGACLL